MEQQITEITRRNIVDELIVMKVNWAGRLNDVEFLDRLYSLEIIPSNDSRFNDAKGDIYQHTVRNNDWDSYWIFYDSRFNLLKESDSSFLRFLCEMIHPAIRPDDEEVGKLVEMFNRHLNTDGFKIGIKTYISEKPIYAASQTLLSSSPTLKSVKLVANALSAEYISQQITRMETAINDDPELAIGTAKELIETISKTILKELKVEVPNNPDLPQLVKLVRAKLNLLPEGVDKEAKGAGTVKRILSNLGTIAQGLAELRGLYGTGHGKEAKTSGLKSRHARLAVGSATTLAVFLYETYKEKK